MKETVSTEETTTGLRVWQHVVIFLAACTAIISHRPDAVFHAQFWSEDGGVFYADAYNLGWIASLFRSYQGYLHLFPRLGASLALLAPLSSAPLVLNLIAICVQALPTNLLLIGRSASWGSLRFRILLAAVYLALPDCWETNANITNSQLFLALCAFLLLVASEPNGTKEQVFDLCILVLCGLTGPFCILLFPIAIYRAWRPGERWQRIAACVIGMSCSIQVWTLINRYSDRPRYPLGASFVTLTRILVGQVYVRALLGTNNVAERANVVWLIVLACAGTIILIFCLFRSPVPLRLFLFFSAMLLCASLLSASFTT